MLQEGTGRKTRIGAGLAVSESSESLDSLVASQPLRLDNFEDDDCIESGESDLLLQRWLHSRSS